MVEVVPGLIPVRDCHAPADKQVNLLIDGRGGFGKLHFPGPEKKKPPMVRFRGEAWGVLLQIVSGILSPNSSDMNRLNMLLRIILSVYLQTSH